MTRPDEDVVQRILGVGDLTGRVVLVGIDDELFVIQRSEVRQLWLSENGTCVVWKNSQGSIFDAGPLPSAIARAVYESIVCETANIVWIELEPEVDGAEARWERRPARD